MSRRGRNGVSVALVLALVFLCAGGRAVAGERPFEEFLPADVWAYLTLDDIPRAQAALEAIPLGKLLDEPLVKKAVDGFWKDREKEFAAAPPFKGAGLKFRELVELLSRGQAAVVLFSWDLKAADEAFSGEQASPAEAFPGIPGAPGAEQRQPGAGPRPGGRPKKRTPMAKALPELALLVEVTGRRAKVEEFIQRVLRSPEVQKETILGRYAYRGVAVHTVLSREKVDEEGQDWTGVAFAYAFPSDGLFVAGSSKRAVERVIASYQAPPAATLARSRAFRYLARRIGRDRLATFYLDLDRVLAAAWKMPEGEQEKKTVEQVRAVLADLGLDRVKALGGGLRVERGGLLISTVVWVPGMQEQGLWKLMLPLEAQPRSLRLVPRGPLFFVTQGVDFKALWRLVWDLLAKNSPELYNNLMKTRTTAEQTLQLNLETDLVALLGRESATAFLRPPPPAPLPPPDPDKPFDFERMMAAATRHAPDTMFYLSLEDARRFKTVLEKILTLGPQALGGGPPGAPVPRTPGFQVEEFRGFELHIQRGGKAMGGFDTVYCVTTDGLVGASGRGAVNKVKAALRGLGGRDSLASNPDFARPLALLGREGRVAIFYCDVVGVVEQFRKAALGTREAMMPAFVAPGGDEKKGGEELQAYRKQVEEERRKARQVLDLLEKHVHPLVGVVLKERDGLVVRFYVH